MEIKIQSKTELGYKTILTKDEKDALIELVSDLKADKEAVIEGTVKELRAIRGFLTYKIKCGEYKDIRLGYRRGTLVIQKITLPKLLKNKGA